MDHLWRSLEGVCVRWTIFSRTWYLYHLCLSLSENDQTVCGGYVCEVIGPQRQLVAGEWGWHVAGTHLEIPSPKTSQQWHVNASNAQFTPHNLEAISCPTFLMALMTLSAGRSTAGEVRIIFD